MGLYGCHCVTTCALSGAPLRSCHGGSPFSIPASVPCKQAPGGCAVLQVTSEAPLCSCYYLLTASSHQDAVEVMMGQLLAVRLEKLATVFEFLESSNNIEKATWRPDQPGY